MATPATETLAAWRKPRLPPKGPPMNSPSGPSLLPTKRTSRQLLLEPAMWERLKRAAKFHSDVFKTLGSNEGVSRNDLIESFLSWALGAYWEDKGGEPLTAEDWMAKVKAYADKIRKMDAKARPLR